MGQTNSQIFMNQTSLYNKNLRKGQPTLNIDAIDDGESQYCLEQLISPNFQPQSTISMQKRLQKQQQAQPAIQRGNNNSNSTTKFQMSGNIHFFGNNNQNEQNSGNNSRNKYSSLFKKNSTRSSRMESPSCHQQVDSVAQSLTKNKNNKQKNVRKIMNDSLNMITKSRNKYLNKSFQQNNSSSSATRLGQTSFGGDTTLNASGNQHMSLKKVNHSQRPGAETSMKKLNSTASYDILGMQREHDNLDNSYGRLGPDLFNKNPSSKMGGGMKSPLSFAQNWSNQNTNTLNSNNNNMVQSQISGGSSSINIIQSQISQKFQNSNQKLSSDRDQLNSRNFNNFHSQSNGGLTSNVSTTNKKNNFKFNFKTNMGCSTGMLNTPMGRSQNMNQSNIQDSSNLNQFTNASNDLQTQDLSAYNLRQQDYQFTGDGSSSNNVSPLSSLPKRQLNFSSKGQQQQQPSLKTQSSHQSNQNLITTAPSTSISNVKNPQILKSNLQQQQLLKQYQSQNANVQLSAGVRPFDYNNNGSQSQEDQQSHGQKDLMNIQRQQYFLDNLDQNDFIDPNLFYQQQAVSTTSQHSQSMSHEAQMLSNKNNKNQFRVPKISKLQLQQSFHHQPTNLGCLTNNHKVSQQQFLSMGENSDFSQEPTLKRSLTPSSGYYSINQLTVNQSGVTEKQPNIQSKLQRKKTNQNFQQLQLIDMHQNDMHQYSTQMQNQTFQNINPHDDSLMMILEQNNMNSSQLHNQPPSSGEDISFNIDCSQAFQMTNQTIDRPVTVGDINNSVKMRDLLVEQRQQNNQAVGSRNRIKNLNTIGQDHVSLQSRQQLSTVQDSNNVPDTLKTRQVDESIGGQSENLETSRFSSTLETQIQHNSQILTNQNTIESQGKQMNQVQDYSQSQRFLKVAPNAIQIKKAMLNQVNQRKLLLNEAGVPHLNIQGQVNAGQKQYFSKIKNDSKTESFIQNQHSKEYIKQLKQEMENRRDQQLKRNQELFQDQPNLIAVMNNSSYLNGGNHNNINQTQLTGNNIYILNSAVKSQKGSSNKQSSSKHQNKGNNTCKNQKMCYQRRDISADNLPSRRRDQMSQNSSESSDNDSCCDSQSQTSSPCSCQSCLRSKTNSKLQSHKQLRNQSHKKQQHSHASSSFIESSQQEECKECLDSKCQSRLCCQCNESERCSKMSKNHGNGSRMNHNKQNYRAEGATSNMSKRQQKIRKDRDGRQYIKYKDNVNNQIYRIDAPNNVFFNDDLDLANQTEQNSNVPSFQHRGRQLKNYNSNFDQQIDEETIDRHNTQNLIPIVKRNLTPDDHLRKEQAESYILVDQKGKPKKIYIQRNVPVKVHTPNKDNNFNLQSSQTQLQQQSRTLDYEDQNTNTANNNNLKQQFSTIQNAGIMNNKTKTQNIQSQRKKFLNGTGGANGGGGESSLICCLSTKSQRDYSKYDSKASQKSDTASNKSRGGKCSVQ